MISTRPCKRSLATRAVILCILAGGCLQPILSQNHHINFEHLGTQAGLSMNNVNAIVRDQFGFIWVATEDGLNRYDGYRFRIYRNDPDDPHSLTDNYVGCLLIDSRNRLWIGTRTGMNLYNPELDNFSRFTTGTDDSTRLNNKDIKDITEDSKGNLWIAGDTGVDQYIPERGIFRHFKPDRENPQGLSNTNSYKIVENHEGKLWIATGNGLNLMDPETGKFRRFFPDPRNPYSISSNYIRALLPDRNNNLWIGTYENGIDYYDSATDRFIHFEYGKGRRNALSHHQVNDMAFHWDGNLWVATTEGLNFIEIDHRQIERSRITQYLEDPNSSTALTASHIQSIYMDSSRVWLATRFGGINIYDKYGSKFQKISTVSTDGTGLSHLNVTSFTEDSRGRLIIGTDGGGVNIQDPETGEFRYLFSTPGNPNSLTSNKVLSVLYEAPNTLWIGMWSGGVNRYDLQTGRMIRYRHDPRNPWTISNDNVFCLFIDSRNQLWVGTWSSGLNRYDRGTNSYIRYPFNVTDGSGTSGETIVSIYEDSEKRLWFTTEGQGLNLLDHKNNKFTYYQADENDPASISGNYTIAVLQDRQGRLWVTTTNGLNLLDTKTGKFTVFHQDDGLPAETLYGIREDNEGNLWISSIHGLSCVTPVTDNGKTTIQCTNYTLQDGLQGEQFGQWAYFKNSQGLMLFGGLNGFNLFDPDNIQKNPVPPVTLINGFQLSLIPVDFRNPGSPLSKPVYLTKEITISHNESMLTFEYVGISFTRPENNQYSYTLENFDRKDEWHKVGTERKATYTNLDPGTYIFRVKAANNDGIWNETGTALTIHIPPPFYQRAWFIILMVLALLALAYWGYHARMRSLEVRHQKLENEITERTAELKAKSVEIESSYQMLAETGHAVVYSSQMVNKATEQISQAMNEVKSGAISQNLFVQQTREKIDALLATLRTATYQTKTSTKAAEKTVQAVESGTSSMQETLDSIKSVEKTVNDTWEIMKNLMEHSARIDHIVQFIDDVASRVNVLALNALIEAKKAGEYGRGFMVVAQEIRQLASSTTQSTLEITEFITKIQEDVHQIEKVTKSGLENVRTSTKVTDEGRAVLNQITKSVALEKERLMAIAEKINEMQSYSQDVQEAIVSVASVSEQNRENVEKVNQSTTEVGLRIQELTQLAQTLDSRSHKETKEKEGGAVHAS
ncbi:hypothetical protein JW948_18360 [bacterium]|nr:hypothetical protein [bacterium]